MIFSPIDKTRCNTNVPELRAEVAINKTEQYMNSSILVDLFQLPN